MINVVCLTSISISTLALGGTSASEDGGSAEREGIDNNIKKGEDNER
jgi:hypothetical protein